MKPMILIVGLMLSVAAHANEAEISKDGSCVLITNQNIAYEIFSAAGDAYRKNVKDENGDALFTHDANTVMDGGYSEFYNPALFAGSRFVDGFRYAVKICSNKGQIKQKGPILQITGAGAKVLETVLNQPGAAPSESIDCSSDQLSANCEIRMRASQR